MTVIVRTEPRTPRADTARRRVLDRLRAYRGVDVRIGDLHAAAWPDQPLPPTNRLAQQRIGPLVAALRQAGWPVEPGRQRRTYRLF